MSKITKKFTNQEIEAWGNLQHLVLTQESPEQNLQVLQTIKTFSKELLDFHKSVPESDTILNILMSKPKKTDVHIEQINELIKKDVDLEVLAPENFYETITLPQRSTLGIALATKTCAETLISLVINGARFPYHDLAIAADGEELITYDYIIDNITTLLPGLNKYYSTVKKVLSSIFESADSFAPSDLPINKTILEYADYPDDIIKDEQEFVEKYTLVYEDSRLDTVPERNKLQIAMMRLLIKQGTSWNDIDELEGESTNKYINKWLHGIKKNNFYKCLEDLRDVMTLEIMNYKAEDMETSLLGYFMSNPFSDWGIIHEDAPDHTIGKLAYSLIQLGGGLQEDVFNIVSSSPVSGVSLGLFHIRSVVQLMINSKSIEAFDTLSKVCQGIKLDDKGYRDALTKGIKSYFITDPSFILDLIGMKMPLAVAKIVNEYNTIPVTAVPLKFLLDYDPGAKAFVDSAKTAGIPFDIGTEKILSASAEISDLELFGTLPPEAEA